MTAHVIDGLLCSMSLVMAAVCCDDTVPFMSETGEGESWKMALEQGSTMSMLKVAAASTPSTEAIRRYVYVLWWEGRALLMTISLVAESMLMNGSDVTSRLYERVLPHEGVWLTANGIFTG